MDISKFLKLAEKLERHGIKIIGTDFKSLDLAEDRGRFGALIERIGLEAERREA